MPQSAHGYLRYLFGQMECEVQFGLDMQQLIGSRRLPIFDLQQPRPYLLGDPKS